MAITGSKREQVEYQKKVGLFSGKVLAINPDKEELEKLFPSRDPKDIKDPEYMGENEEGKAKLRLVFYVQDEKTKSVFNVNFFLEDAPVNASKKTGNLQYVSSQGKTYWGDPDNMPSWFVPEGGNVTTHVARKGEAEVLEFLNSWLNIDRDRDYSIELNWENLMRGNVRELRELITSDMVQPVVFLAYVKVKQEDAAECEEPTIKEYQGIYTRKFLPGYHLKYFRTVKFTPAEITRLRRADKKELKPFERYALDITDDEYGLKDFYGTILGELKDYNPEENVAAQADPVLSSSADDAPDYD